MVELPRSSWAVALSSYWTGAGSLKVYPNEIVLASTLCAYVHADETFIDSYSANVFRI